MAERISKIKKIEKTDAQLKAESLDEVTSVIAENKDSILKAIDLIGILDEAKILDGLKGAVKQRGVITEKIVTELNKDQYSGILHNMGQMLFLLGSLDTDELSVLLNKVNKGLRVANQANPNARSSVSGLVKVLKDDEINQSLTYFLNILKGMSR
ncbi:DUF1641 domain-containing protein [Staphylococcus felis]|uniref:DUF1641 domain-containing protein n=1 Tax=Staphylococcus felis TaxID=46127 RepID=UPI000E28468F|nr:DUF1641 domain-containing protein [Staphylococcus felis]REH94962.1 DUF1641 domain-containing protein [Staphylococcus felis]